jgi:KaiC/GvpD/RAD55 family RecA-like ATPase
MSIEHLIYNLGLEIPAIIGMLTIFGRKKNEKPDESKQLDPPSPSEIPSLPEKDNDPVPIVEKREEKMVPTFPSQVEQRPQHVFRDEETSLNKLLQSIIQDLPGSGLTDEVQSGREIPATPDYVPLRATPPSRPMVIDPKGSSKEVDEQVKEDNGDKPIAPQRYSRSAEVPVSQVKVQPNSPSTSSKDQDVADRARQEKPDKPERPEKPARQASKKDSSTRQEFNHIFQLTQGNLEAPGLVIINGSPGSGRTTLCAALTDNYMKLGNPCLYVTYDQSPSVLRDQMKALGGNPSHFESQFRFILVDGFSSQSDSFSMEPYYVEQPFDFANIQDVLTRNAQIFSGDKVRLVFDSLDKIAAKVPQKDFVKKFGELVSKIRDLGATFIVTIDLSKLPKDAISSLEEAADCIIDILRDNSDMDSRDLKVRKLNKSYSKIEPETFQVETGKGLVFVG